MVLGTTGMICCLHSSQRHDRLAPLGHSRYDAKATNNQTLVEVCKTLNRRIRQEYTALMSNALDNVSEENLKAAVSSAKVVYQRIKARDPKGARFAMQRHLSIVLEHEKIKKTSDASLNEPS